MSDINLGMQKTIEIVMSVLVIFSCFAAIYTYDAQSNYLLSFSSTKLKIIYDDLMMYHDKGILLSLNEYYPFDTDLYEDKIELKIDNKKIVTQIETIYTLNKKTTQFKDSLKLKSEKPESFSILFENDQLILESNSLKIIDSDLFCEKIYNCEFEDIPKDFFFNVLNECKKNEKYDNKIICN